MSFEINWAYVIDDIRSLETAIRERVIKKVGSIKEQPFRYVEHLEGYPLFKLRIGDYRAVLDIKKAEEEITVVLVAHRSKVYKALQRRKPK